MQHIIAIAIGGALGALGRYWVSGWVYGHFGREFPWGTLTVNVAGSLVMGFLFVLLVEKAALPPFWRSLITVGGLGAFTTFSTFSLETVQLIESGGVSRAFLNVVVSAVLCVGAAWLGVVAGRNI